MPIVECGSRFTSPVRWGDTMQVTATVAWVKEKMFRVEYEVKVGARLCANGLRRARVGRRPSAPDEPLRARPIPAEIVAKLTKEDRA